METLRLILVGLISIGSMPALVFLFVRIHDYVPEEWEKNFWINKKWLLYSSAICLILIIASLIILLVWNDRPVNL